MINHRFVRSTTVALCAILGSLAFASASQADTYKQVSVSGLNTCAVTTANTVKCWGENSSGSLGNGTFDPSSTPTTVLAGPGQGPLTGVKSVVAGTTACALMLNGTVKCWGWAGWPSERLGLLGVDDFDHPDSPYPLTVVAAHGSTAPLSNVVQLGGLCALLADGRVKCWGNNDAGAVGDGTQTNRAAPVFVRSSSAVSLPLTNVKTISRLSTTSCATLTNGLVKCWGDNAWHQINDSNDGQITAPTYVHTGPLPSQLLSGVKEVHSGSNHECALLNSGKAKCWGLNSNGELGRGFGKDAGGEPFPYADYVVTASGSSTPVSGIAEMTGQCLIRTDRTAGCWGENVFGNLGDGTTTGTDAPSTVVTSESDSTPLANIDSIDGGLAGHACAILSDHTLRCWGYNEFGQLGDGTTANHSAPVPIG